jgi:hypothetical protein
MAGRSNARENDLFRAWSRFVVVVVVWWSGAVVVVECKCVVVAERVK